MKMLRMCVTWVEACVWAEPPSAGLYEPVRTTPSANGSKGASIYLPTEYQDLSFMSTDDFWPLFSCLEQIVSNSEIEFKS